MEKIEISILQQREYRAFRILRGEEEFAQMQEVELKEKIHAYASKVADRKINEAVLLEFIRQCVREPEILEQTSVNRILRIIKEKN